MSEVPEQVTHFHEDDDPEQLIGEDLEDVPKEQIDPEARYTLAEWEALRAMRGDV